MARNSIKMEDLKYVLQNTVNAINYVKEDLVRGDPLTFGIIIALAVVFVTSILIFIVRRKRNLRKAVLIVGLSEAGKTLLFSRLVASRKVSTYTSMKENSSIIQVSNKGALRLVDLPGNERLRGKFLDQYKPLARGVIFVIDSLNFSRELKDVAEFLYSVLSDRVINQNSLPFLIACNKQDETMAKGSKVIQSQLEKEMNTLRITRSAALDSTTDTGNNNAFLGKRGRDFQFSDLKPIAVDFAECSILGIGGGGDGDEADIDSIYAWLCKIA